MRRLASIFLLLTLSGLGFAQTAVLLPAPKLQFLNASGVPLSGGCVQSYAAGTTTPQATFTDSTGGTSNANPVILDSAGRASIFLTQGIQYKFVVTSTGGSNCSTGTLQYTQDNVALGSTLTVGGSNTQVEYNSSGALAGSSNFTWNNATQMLSIGALVTTSGGTLAGVFAGNPTFSGNPNFSGVTVAKNLNTIRYASQYAGADWCTQANAADTDIGSGVGVIVIDKNVVSTACAAVLVQTGYRVYQLTPGTSYTAPLGDIVCSKACIFDGGTRRTSLTFTGASGIAFFAQWGPNGAGDYQDWGAGIRNLTLIGPGGLTGSGNVGTGIQIGDATHAAIGFQTFNVQISGFTLGTTWGTTNAWGAKFDHSNWVNNTQEVLYNQAGGIAVENVEFIHSGFAASNINNMNPNGLQFTTGGAEIDFIDCSFDGDQLVVSAGIVKRFGAHHENPNGNTTNYYVQVNSGGQVVDFAPNFLQDNSSGSVPTAFVNVNGGSYTYTRARFFTNFTMAEAVNVQAASGFVVGDVQFASVFTNGITNGTANASEFFSCPDPTANPSAVCNLGNFPIQMPLGITNPAANTSTIYTQSGVGPTISGQNFQIRTGAGAPADVVDVTSGGTLVAQQALQMKTTLFGPSNLLWSATAPTIAGAGCGGSAASIATNNGTGAFSVNVGTAPLTACTITMPTATAGWNCYATDITTNSTAVFLQKQTATGASSVTITNFNDVAVAANFTASDILQVSCFAR